LLPRVEGTGEQARVSVHANPYPDWGSGGKKEEQARVRGPLTLRVMLFYPQVGRELYGANSPVIVDGKGRETTMPPQPMGWIWQAAQGGLFVGCHYDVAEHTVQRSATWLGVEQITIDDGSDRFVASYGKEEHMHELGMYDTPWLAAWTHDAAVLRDVEYLARCPPMALNGVPRPVGFVYCPHNQRTVLDTCYLRGRIG
jgi:hypothetical protein